MRKFLWTVFGVLILGVAVLIAIDRVEDIIFDEIEAEKELFKERLVSDEVCLPVIYADTAKADLEAVKLLVRTAKNAGIDMDKISLREINKSPGIFKKGNVILEYEVLKDVRGFRKGITPTRIQVVK